MLETVAIILLVLVCLAILGWLGTFVVALIIGNKARKQIQSQFSDENPFPNYRSTRTTNWRNRNGF